MPRQWLSRLARTARRTMTIDLPSHSSYGPGMDRRRFLLTSLAGALAARLGAEAQPALAREVVQPGVNVASRSRRRCCCGRTR